MNPKIHKRYRIEYNKGLLYFKLGEDLAMMSELVNFEQFVFFCQRFSALNIFLIIKNILYLNLLGKVIKHAKIKVHKNIYICPCIWLGHKI